MNAGKPLPPSRLLAALAALALPLLSGCATGVVAFITHRHHDVGDVVGAYARQDELAIAYTVVGPGGHTRIAWFTRTALCKDDTTDPSWGLPPHLPVRPARDLYLHGGPLKGVQPVAVTRLGSDQQELPPLPPGAQMQVCYWPSAVHAADEVGQLRVFVLLRSDKGAVLQRRVYLPCHGGYLWWFYALQPITLTVDIVTFPLQVVVALLSVTFLGH
ncbi:MAG: hypothetical protein FJ291_30100 [Planctomycetes bacterium]|nr:hypothetical protein [Planctomycetota bacterium]